MRRERQLLVDHRDAGAPRIDRAGGRIAPAVDGHRPGVGRQRAREDRHQRALAGAVLADEPADLPAGDGELDAVERDGGAERLADVAHRESLRSVRNSCHAACPP